MVGNDALDGVEVVVFPGVFLGLCHGCSSCMERCGCILVSGLPFFGISRLGPIRHIKAFGNERTPDVASRRSAGRGLIMIMV